MSEPLDYCRSAAFDRPHKIKGRFARHSSAVNVIRYDGIRSSIQVVARRDALISKCPELSENLKREAIRNQFVGADRFIRRSYMRDGISNADSCPLHLSEILQVEIDPPCVGGMGLRQSSSLEATWQSSLMTPILSSRMSIARRYISTRS